MSLRALDTRRRIAFVELAEKLAEAAFDQSSPTPALVSALQKFSAFLQHPDRRRE